MAKRSKQEYYFFEALHYVIVYGALLISWVPLMDYFGGNLLPTAISGLIIFAFVDQIVHKIFEI